MATQNDESQITQRSDLTQENRNMSSDTSSTKPPQPQTVRFASVNQEIEPAHSIQSLTTLSSNISISNPEFSPEAQEEIRNLSRSLQSSPLQQRRMNHFTFEPVSLPTSRVSKPLMNSRLRQFSRIKCCASLHSGVSIEPVVGNFSPIEFAPELLQTSARAACTSLR